MNQKNGKNSLGIDSCFEDLDNPIELFKKWFAKAEKTEINDPNAVAVATSNKDNQPNVRMVLLKGLSDKGFVFYTNFNSKKGSELKENLKASMCFHWKSLRRQVRVIGSVEEVTKKEADDYYNSRPYKNRIGAWASLQSQKLDKRKTFLEKIKESLDVTVLTEKEIFDVIQDESQKRVSFYDIIHDINKSLDKKGKVDVLKMLWEIAYADKVLDVDEERIIRRSAEMLGIKPSIVLQTKEEFKNQ